MENIPGQEWGNGAIVISPGQTEKLQGHGTMLSIVVPTAVTNDRFGLYEIEMEAQARGPKLHYHRHTDETFIIREGTLTVLTAEGSAEAGPGTVIHLPRLSAHGYNNDSEAVVRMTMIFNPGFGREDFFRTMYRLLDEQPDDMAAFLELYTANDSYPLDLTNMIPMRPEE